MDTPPHDTNHLFTFFVLRTAVPFHCKFDTDMAFMTVDLGYIASKAVKTKITSYSQRPYCKTSSDILHDFIL